MAILTTWKKINMFLQVYEVSLKGFIFIKGQRNYTFQQLESTRFYNDKWPGIIMTTLTARKWML